MQYQTMISPLVRTVPMMQGKKDAEVICELYGPFGRKIAQFKRISLGNANDSPECYKFLQEYKKTGKKCWFRYACKV